MSDRYKQKEVRLARRAGIRVSSAAGLEARRSEARVDLKGKEEETNVAMGAEDDGAKA
jgi:hypothetical protein